MGGRRGVYLPCRGRPTPRHRAVVVGTGQQRRGGAGEEGNSGKQQSHSFPYFDFRIIHRVGAEQRRAGRIRGSLIQGSLAMTPFHTRA